MIEIIFLKEDHYLTLKSILNWNTIMFKILISKEISKQF